MTTRTKTSIAFIAMLALLLTLAGCGEQLRNAGDQASSREPATTEKSRQESASATRAGEGHEDQKSPKSTEKKASARADNSENSKKRAENNRARSGDASSIVDKAMKKGDGSKSRRVMVKVRGDRGTGFSGACAVGKEEGKLEGQVPENFVYELDGRRLKCDLRKQSSAGELKIILVSGGDRHVQRTNSSRAALNFAYSGGGFSSVTRASGPGSQSINSSSQDSSVRKYSSP